MDHRNKSIPQASVTSFDVNKAIQRSLTKACARHGLGLYIYAGEDLPEGEAQQPQNRPPLEMATQDQIDYISDHATAEQLESCVRTYGLNCEKMPYGVAVKLINKLKGATA